jgi:type IV pilus assembly protein PilB
MATAQHELLGELLVKEGLIEASGLQQALALQKKEGGKLGYHLVALGLLHPEDLGQFLQRRFGVVSQEITSLVRDPAVLDLVPAKVASFYRVVPISLHDNVLTVAMGDAGRKEVLNALEQITRYRVEALICSAPAVARALESLYGSERDAGVKLNLCGDNEFYVSDKTLKVKPIVPELLHPDSPAVDWLRTALATAIKLKTREIHFVPEETRIAIWFRLRQERREYYTLNGEKKNDLESLIDKLARLNPQGGLAALEGRFRVVIAGRRLSAMVSALSTLYGRRYMIRLVDEQLMGQAAIEALGPSLTEVLGFAGGKGGLLLVAGPATAGKELLLAGLLAEIRKRSIVQNVMLLEDRTFAPLPGVIQIELDPGSGRSLGPTLEGAFRQAPDLIAINEIHEPRELELAFLAAARKPVIALLATRDAATALEYVCEAGLQSAAKAGVLAGILGVRAFAPLCGECAKPLPAAEAKSLGLASADRLFYNAGCPACLDNPVQSRRILAEWLPVSALAVKQALEGKVRSEPLRAALRQGGVPLLEQTALKAAEGKLIDARDLAGIMGEEK